MHLFLVDTSKPARVTPIMALPNSGSVAPPLLSSISQGGGGSPEKNFFLLKSQLRHLATFVPRLGRVGQGAWELGLPPN